MVDLKPCPFCKETTRVNVRRDDSRHPWPLAVACDFCGATGPENCFSDLAIAAWNRRAREARDE
jgi:Lar family restriction alleviation protein